VIQFALPLLVIACGCYLASRFAMLAGWRPISGGFRLLGLWAAAAWVGYSTPLYVALLCLPLGFLWAKLEPRWLALIGFELGFAAAIMWFSQTPQVIVFIIAVVLFDQLVTRLLLSRYDNQREPRYRLHQFIIIAATLCCGLIVARYYWHFIDAYARSHSPAQIVNLQPEGAAPLWFYKRTLKGAAAGRAQEDSVYWQSRYPETGKGCALSFHGAARTASLQSAARTMARASMLAGRRLFAVDHPGFGASPPPSTDASPDAWDPALLTEAVLAQMELSGCKDTLVIGHSQGVTEALRLFTQSNALVSNAVVFGAGLYAKDEDSENYWYDRFHIDRGLPDYAPVARENWKLIRDLYYLNQEFCADTSAGKRYLAGLQTTDGQPPRSLLFTQFEREHENLVATREQLFACLAYPEVTRNTLPTDHYFDSLQINALVFVQRSSPSLVAELLRTAAPLSDADSLATSTSLSESSDN